MAPRSLTRALAKLAGAAAVITATMLSTMTAAHADPGQSFSPTPCTACQYFKADLLVADNAAGHTYANGTYVITVSNQGLVDAPASHASLTFNNGDPSVELDVPPIPAGESRQIWQPGPFLPNVYVTVNSRAEIDESDYTNNTTVLTYRL